MGKKSAIITLGYRRPTIPRTITDWKETIAEVAAGPVHVAQLHFQAARQLQRLRLARFVVLLAVHGDCGLAGTGICIWLQFWRTGALEIGPQPGPAL